MHQQRDHLSCYYGLTENPKRKTQRSPEPMRKILFRCGDCEKGFRYEKCLSNHRAVMHSSTNKRVCEELVKSLCSSARKKKKRSRVMRHKTPLSCSFNTILDEELEVAECLILLSKSSPKFVVDGVQLAGEAMDAVHQRASGFLSEIQEDAEIEFGFVSNDQKLGEERLVDVKHRRNQLVPWETRIKSISRNEEEPVNLNLGFLRNEQILVEEDIGSDEESASFLGHKCELESGDTEFVTECDKRNVEHLLITRKQSNDEGLGLLSAVPFTIGVKFYSSSVFSNKI